MLSMINEALREELSEMTSEDLKVRQELLDSGELGGAYVPRMEAVHVKNAARLRELIQEHGWPAEDIASKDGAEAAWLIAQHAIGEPEFQKHALQLLNECATTSRTPRWHAAYLEDRINMLEGRPQRYGSQWMDDSQDGRTRPWKLSDPARVNEWRASVGLPPLHPIPELGPDLPPEQRKALEDNQRWWQEWAVSKGWTQGR